MASRKPVVIDGEYRMVTSDARLSDVTSPDVQSVVTSDGQLIARGDFARWPVPEGFETNLTPQVKG
jgi:hypothetical protein